MDRRYTRLYVSPECAKVVVNWSREDLNIPFKTPISFEHDFVEEETRTDASAKKGADDHVRLESGTTRWNAKMLLMSGLSRNAWEELSSERSYEERIPHLCNMLRFALLKDGSSLMAIGGSWDTVDGNDPSLDKSSLVRTVLRYTKELTGLDLKNCRHWNPFLEIHYDRVGKDGRFSHKEVTVLYIPDLSDCLPSIDAWRDQWLSNKKAIAERERLQALKGKKLREKKEAPKDKEPGTTKDLKKVDKADKKKEAGSDSKVNEKGKAGTKDKAKEAVKDDKADAVMEKKEGAEIVGEGSNSGKKNLTGNADVQTPGSGKKKIIRKVVKKKVVAEKDDTVDSKNVENTAANTEVINEGTEPSATPSTVKTSTDKKTTVKKKIVKKVAKKKVANNKDEVAKENVMSTTIGEETAASENQETKVKSENNKSVSEKKKEEGGSNEIKHKDKKIQVKEEKKAKADGGQSDKNKKSMDGKERNDKDGKVESKIKEVKDKKKAEEPPRHPGFFIQTKGRKHSKLRSLSLSLDSLLDYTDKDIEESTFELSLFAETFYEMLQYQMGSRILTFLQKLRTKFLSKMNQKKRQREEVSDKKKKEKTSSAKKPSPKRLKTEDGTVESKSVKTETLQEASSVDEKTVVKDENMLTDNVDNTKPEDELDKEEDSEDDPDEDPEEDPNEDPEEDPEEDREEDETMEEATPQNDAEIEEKAEVEKVDMEVKSENMDTVVKEEKEKTTKVTVSSDKSEVEKKENPKVDTKKKEAPLDKELLQAFRFFDRNRVGYVRVEDLRLILHALGKSMSHRDVKELVQSALLESNTGRDDRVLYRKLVKMTDI